MQSILNWIILSSYICKPLCCFHLFSLILQSILLICLKNCHSGLENTRFRTKSQGGCHMFHPQQWWYTNLTNYEFPCKILMQLSRKSYTNQGRTYQISFFILTYYNMVFKMAMYLVLEKKKCIFTFIRKIFWGCLKLWKWFSGNDNI